MPLEFRYEIGIKNLFLHSIQQRTDFIANFFGLVRTIGENESVCYHCGTQFTVNNNLPTMITLHTTYYFCSDYCMKQYVQCWDCGRLLDSSEVQISSDRMLCFDCFSRNFVRCNRCQILLMRSDGLRCHHTGAWFCQECYDITHSQCVRCENWILNDYVCIFNSNHPMCPEIEGPYCERCYNKLSSALHEWDFRPNPIFYGESFPYYGVELEVDNFKSINGNAATQFMVKLDPKEKEFYCKGDGSLGNGFEVVFHPRTINLWSNYQERLEEITKELKDQGGRSYNTRTCGVHVHRSRNDIGIITRSKLIMLFSKLRRHIIKLSQRTSSYASFDVFSETEGKKLLSYKTILDERDVAERYQALNFMPNATIEFRVFKGTLHIPTLLAYIGFCHYITDYAKMSLMSDIDKRNNDAVWLDFCLYLDSKTKHPLVNEIISYLMLKNLFVIKPKNSKGVKPCVL